MPRLSGRHPVMKNCCTKPVAGGEPVLHRRGPKTICEPEIEKFSVARNQTPINSDVTNAGRQKLKSPASLKPQNKLERNAYDNENYCIHLHGRSSRDR